MFGTVGMPQPRSMNWLIPLPAAQRVARARNCLFSRMTSAAIGATASSFTAHVPVDGKIVLAVQQIVVYPGD